MLNKLQLQNLNQTLCSKSEQKLSFMTCYNHESVSQSGSAQGENELTENIPG